MRQGIATTVAAGLMVTTDAYYLCPLPPILDPPSPLVGTSADLDNLPRPHC